MRLLSVRQQKTLLGNSFGRIKSAALRMKFKSETEQQAKISNDLSLSNQLATTPCTHPIVLVDNDPLVHLVWRLAAKNHRKIFIGYLSQDELLRSYNKYSQETPIYIDLDLDKGRSGIELADALKKLGFRNLRLATGHSFQKIELPSHILEAVGKEPPFGLT